MHIDHSEASEDLLDSLYLDLEPGDIWGNSLKLYLIVLHEECGCSFLRAVSITGPHEYQLIAHRDDELIELLANSGFEKLGHLEARVGDLGSKPPKKRVAKKAKKVTKTKASKKKKA